MCKHQMVHACVYDSVQVTVHSVLNRLAVMLVAMTSFIGLQAEVHNVKGSGKVGVLSDNSLLQ